MPRFLIAALAVLTAATTSFAQGIIAPTAGPINSSMAGASVAAPVDFGGSYWLGSSPGNTCPMGWDFLNCLFPPCWGGLSPQTPFHGGNRHGLSGYFVYLGHAM